MDCLLRIGDWFVEEIFTYIIVWGSNGKPHVLPLYVPDKLLCREVSHQTIRIGITLELKKASKKLWLEFPL